ncbi:MAG: dTDP-glucose 4,6-dehydratase [Paenibacillaceae bacterium]
MKRLLVTGGAGFIGSNFIRYMLEIYKFNIHITNIDLLTYAGNPSNLADFKGLSNYQFVQGNITDTEFIRHMLQEQFDAIVHFAAESHVDRSIEGPMAFFQTNVLGTLVLLEAARECGIERFIHISTDEVYGTLGPRGLFTESTALLPNSPYSASKASSDLAVRAYYHTFGFPAIITRCSNNYGPRQYPEKLIPRIITNALQDKPIPVYGDGGQIRDWLHVNDHCKAIDLVLSKGQPGEVYNIGSNSETTNLEMTKRILDELNKPHSLIQFVQDRLGHDRRYAINSSKIQKELYWHSEITLDQGIQDTIHWYERNEDWWNPLLQSESL